jgi:hypothetical protein
MPRVLEHYRYFWKHLDRRYIDRYSYLEGFAFAMGPVETAALVVGYENFLMGLIDQPEAVWITDVFRVEMGRILLPMAQRCSKIRMGQSR